MFSSRELRLAAVLLAAAAAQAGAAPFPGIGRPATAAELAAWDIDVRPDFQGLPEGAGSVAQGQVVWEGQCASCHGVFGESNVVFSPLVGGTTKDDSRTGHAARLNDAGYPGRTTLMKLSSLSTLWDYIRRAMPWNAPKSLSTTEVYAVTAYLLHLGGIVPDGFTLSNHNIAEVQKLLPNRHGMTTEHALWPGPSVSQRHPDTQARACMTHCAAEPRVVSALPHFARDAHGNLAEQNRSVGAQRGADTRRPAGAGWQPTEAAALPAPPEAATAATALTQKHACTACHGVDHRIVGPAFREIAKKYAGRADALDHLAGKARAGSVGTWGPIPMPAQALDDADARSIAQWLVDGAGK
jgi:S-disulfanyl-L-cysteine oxidoreductase SoxD